MTATTIRTILGVGLVSSVAIAISAAEPAEGLAARLAAENTASLAAAAIREGDPARGAEVFHARQLACTQCHSAETAASPLGPNLAMLSPGVEGDRLVPHLVEAILAPSASVRPEYRGVTIITDDGKSLTGLIVRETSDAVVLRDLASGGREITIPQAAIEERVPTATSLMPVGLASLLGDRGQFLDLVAYLAAIAEGGPPRAAELAPDPLRLASQEPATYEREIDHASFISDWRDPAKSAESLERGEMLFSRVCANCHGTLQAAGSLPSATRFAEGVFKGGSDPYAIYRTLTHGSGMMVPQFWMVPSQKYDVIHYLRETFLKDRNPRWYTAITPAYLASLPVGTTRGPEPSQIEPWRLHDYGPFLTATIEVGGGRGNIARKGLAVRLDDGPGGVGRGKAWILYELDTLRAAAFWTGERFIDWGGINFDGRHGAHPRVSGDVQAAVATMPGWADPESGSFDDPRPKGRDAQSYGPLPRTHVRFKSLHHVNRGGTVAEPRSGVVLDYLVGVTRVMETPSLGRTLIDGERQVPVLVRSFSICSRPRALAVRLATNPASAAIVGNTTSDGHADDCRVADDG
ncbi:MAG: DUF6797 domain-containing protein [Planctomycetaceae bacterium]